MVLLWSELLLPFAYEFKILKGQIFSSCVIRKNATFHDFCPHNFTVIAFAMLKSTQTHSQGSSAWGWARFCSWPSLGAPKKRPKVPSFSCPFPVPICIIQSTEMKIMRNISLNGSNWTLCILVIYPWNLKSIGSRFLGELHADFSLITVMIFF